MSVHFVVGRPGGGKGLYSVQRIVEELRTSERAIATNLPVRVEPWVRTWGAGKRRRSKPELGLRAYLLREYGDDYGVRDRLHILGDDDVGEFFLTRRLEGKWVRLDARRDQQGRVVEYDTASAIASGGHLYVTDEAWRYWGSREWQRTGPGVLYYAAQHRHFGDDWVVVTQHSKQIDTAFRQVAQDFTVLTNHGKRRLGIFRQPGVFSATTYASPPESRTEPELHRRIFRLDAEGLGGCYDTTGGVGIVGGGGADIGERRKGLPIWWALVGVVGLGAAVWGASRLGGAWVMSHFGGSREARADAPSRGPRAGVEPAAESAPRGPRAAVEPAVESAPRGPRGSGAVWMTGYALVRGRPWVCLSDGRMIRPEMVRRLTEYVCECQDGSVYWSAVVHSATDSGSRGGVPGRLSVGPSAGELPVGVSGGGASPF